jgi:transcriptional regulator
MYIPHHFLVEDRQELTAFMRAHSFAALVGLVEGRLFATHLPFVVAERGGELLLRAHLAKNNPQADALAAGGEVVVIFQGPHAYVSPSLYENRQSVPTWNYTAVHASGAASVLPETADKVALLEAMMAEYEPAYREQWEGLSETYRQGMLNGIVAFEVRVTRLEGKYKLSQNRPPGDRRRVAEALASHPDPTVSGVADYMRRGTQG